ncbi:hypothetical protein C7M23_02952 [Bacillus subtilis]|nr:hypothetical protein C7M23_02952 [Bacillus subtilis]
MEETTVFINFETLDLARIYLFGGVKYLDLLLVLSIIDVITGVIKAWKCGAGVLGSVTFGRCSAFWWLLWQTLLIQFST